VVLPRKRQSNFARFIPYHELTRKQVAEAIGVNMARLGNIINGDTYPTPDELDKIEKLFGGMPAQVLFDKEMLEFRENWPPPKGIQVKLAELERLRREAGE
jgi:transcriptional regulator with XRE-family HTH domain